MNSPFNQNFGTTTDPFSLGPRINFGIPQGRPPQDDPTGGMGAIPIGHYASRNAEVASVSPYYQRQLGTGLNLPPSYSGGEFNAAARANRAPLMPPDPKTELAKTWMTSHPGGDLREFNDQWAQIQPNYKPPVRVPVKHTASEYLTPGTPLATPQLDPSKGGGVAWDSSGIHPKYVQNPEVIEANRRAMDANAQERLISSLGPTYSPYKPQQVQVAETQGRNALDLEGKRGSNAQELQRIRDRDQLELEGKRGLNQIDIANNNHQFASNENALKRGSDQENTKVRAAATTQAAQIGADGRAAAARPGKPGPTDDDKKEKFITNYFHANPDMATPEKALELWNKFQQAMGRTPTTQSATQSAPVAPSAPAMQPTSPATGAQNGPIISPDGKTMQHMGAVYDRVNGGWQRRNAAATQPTAQR